MELRKSRGTKKESRNKSPSSIISAIEREFPSPREFPSSVLATKNFSLKTYDRYLAVKNIFFLKVIVILCNIFHSGCNSCDPWSKRTRGKTYDRYLAVKNIFFKKVIVILCNIFHSGCNSRNEEENVFIENRQQNVCSIKKSRECKEFSLGEFQWTH